MKKKSSRGRFHPDEFERERRQDRLRDLIQVRLAKNPKLESQLSDAQRAALRSPFDEGMSLYQSLAERLLGEEYAAEVLLLPTADPNDPHPPSNIGDLTDDVDQRLGEICGDADWASRDERQRILLMEKLLANRESQQQDRASVTTPRRKTGRPRKNETTNDSLVIGAIQSWQERFKSQPNMPPPRGAEIAKRAKVSAIAVTRLLNKVYDGGQQRFETAWRRGEAFKLLQKYIDKGFMQTFDDEPPVDNGSRRRGRTPGSSRD